LDTDWVPFEIEQAVDTYRIPIIAAYTVSDKPIRNPAALIGYWPIPLTERINNGTANVIHIPFKKGALKDAIRFSHADPPPWEVGLESTAMKRIGILVLRIEAVLDQPARKIKGRVVGQVLSVYDDEHTSGL
jgi:hypothetical protein